MKIHFNTLLNAFHQKDKSNLRNFIRISKAQIISGSGVKIHELKKKYSEPYAFYMGLYHVTTTQKAHLLTTNPRVFTTLIPSNVNHQKTF